jgi:hypothetical protein
VLGGFQYTKDPRSVSFRLHDKLVVIHPRKMPPVTTRRERKLLNGCWRKSTIHGSAEQKFSPVSKVLQNQRCSKS